MVERIYTLVSCTHEVQGHRRRDKKRIQGAVEKTDI